MTLPHWQNRISTNEGANLAVLHEAQPIMEENLLIDSPARGLPVTLVTGIIAKVDRCWLPLQA